MRARPGVQGSSLQTGKPGKGFWPVRSGCHFDFATIVAGMFLLLACTGCKDKEAPPRPTPPEVAVVDVVRQNVPIYQEWVAQLNGQVNADITPKVQGYLLTRNYS